MRFLFLCALLVLCACGKKRTSTDEVVIGLELRIAALEDTVARLDERIEASAMRQEEYRGISAAEWREAFQAESEAMRKAFQDFEGEANGLRREIAKLKEEMKIRVQAAQTRFERESRRTFLISKEISSGVSWADDKTQSTKPQIDDGID